MNEDELAAVVAAAQTLMVRNAEGPAVPAAARWNVAGHLGIDDASTARRAARCRSRWLLSGRLNE